MSVNQTLTYVQIIKIVPHFHRNCRLSGTSPASLLGADAASSATYHLPKVRDPHMFRSFAFWKVQKTGVFRKNLEIHDGGPRFWDVANIPPEHLSCQSHWIPLGHHLSDFRNRPYIQVRCNWEVNVMAIDDQPINPRLPKMAPNRPPSLQSKICRRSDSLTWRLDLRGTKHHTTCWQVRSSSFSSCFPLPEKNPKLHKISVTQTLLPACFLQWKPLTSETHIVKHGHPAIRVWLHNSSRRSFGAICFCKSCVQLWRCNVKSKSIARIVNIQSKTAKRMPYQNLPRDNKRRKPHQLNHFFGAEHIFLVKGQACWYPRTLKDRPWVARTMTLMLAWSVDFATSCSKE